MAQGPVGQPLLSALEVEDPVGPEAAVEASRQPGIRPTAGPAAPCAPRPEQPLQSARLQTVAPAARNGAAYVSVCEAG